MIKLLLKAMKKQYLKLLVILLFISCASQPVVQEPPPDPKPKPKPKPPPEKKVDMFRFVPPRQFVDNDAERVRDQITENQSYYTYLYSKHSKIHPDLSGKFVVEIELSANGYVIDCRIESSSMTHDALEKEIVEFIQKLEFGNLEEGEQTVIYEFVF